MSTNIFLNNTRIVLTRTTGLVQFEEVVGPVDYNIYNRESKEQDAARGAYSSLTKIGNYYLLVYSGDPEVGKLKSFSLDSTGGTITELDSLQFDTRLLQPSIKTIDDTHAALSYRGVSNAGVIKTFSIDSTGGTITEIDSLTFATSIGEPSLQVVSSSYLICAYTDAFSANDGVLKTFSMDGNFDNITLVDTLIHDVASALSSALEKISTTHFILGYDDYTNEDATVKTISIDSSADNIAVIDTLVVGDRGDNGEMVKILSDLYIWAYRGLSDAGTFTTMTLDGSYNISSGDTLAQSIYGNTWDCVKIDNTHVIGYYYADATGNGAFTTVGFDTDGDNITEKDVLALGGLGYYNAIVQTVDTQHYLAASTGVDTDGFMYVIYID